MGTRADFYIKKESEMTWLGSIAWDGYPGGVNTEVLEATTESDFKEKLMKFFEDRDDVTLPENGWPWPWKDSKTTDYAYIFEGEKVMGSCFGGLLFDPLVEEEEEYCDEGPTFPDMSSIKNVQHGVDKSGLFIISL